MNNQRAPLEEASKGPEWCPTMGGKFIAYEPQWRETNGKWAVVPYDKFMTDHPTGSIPYPAFEGGISCTIGLCGEAQANALAWSFAAHAAAKGKRLEVRACPYEVVYDLKARLKNPEDAKDLLP